MSNITLGTCGWSYTEWEGNFYDKKTKQSKLRVYSRIFKTAEIDSTFYRNPSKGTVMGWIRYSPSDFMFSAKLPKTVTHDGMLGLKKNIEKDLDVFSATERKTHLSTNPVATQILIQPREP